MKARLGTALKLAIVLAGSVAPAALLAQKDSEKELARVRAEILEVQKSLERQIGRRDDGAAELRKIELALASTRAELKSLDAKIAEQASRRDRIAADQGAATAHLADEQSALAEQVRLTYMTGRQEFLKLLLSQENAADFGRMLVYYDYLNRHRSGQIAAVDAELEHLAGLAVESDAVAKRLAQLHADQEAKAAGLERDEGERKTLIAELDRSIEKSGDRIEQMRRQEAELADIIARLHDTLVDFPVDSDDPFSAQKGKLSWPVEGPHAARFGDKRDDLGRIKWDGDLIEAKAGTAVRAIYTGRVVFAQWATGMGLLLILEHGEGYYSLYGHNAALLKEVGDWVGPGDVIAEVGDTGGQTGTGLYFAIKLDTRSVNPGPWMR
jgi:murein hydrolase activator